MSTPNPQTRTLPPMQKSNRGIYIMLVVIALVFILVLNKALGALSYNFFTSTDNLLKISEHLPPFLMWGFAGMLIGAIIGAVVVARKYKLAFKWVLPSLATATVVFLVFFLISEPLMSNRNERAVEWRDGSDYVQISASSSVPNYEEHNYGPANLLDNDESTAWMYIQKKGQPASITYVFNSELMAKVSHVQLIEIKVAPGYQKNYNKWKSSNKPKDYVIYKNDQEILSGSLEDHFGNEVIKLQNIDLAFGDTIRVDITSCYKPYDRKVNIIAISQMFPVLSFREPR